MYKGRRHQISSKPSLQDEQEASLGESADIPRPDQQLDELTVSKNLCHPFKLMKLEWHILYASSKCLESNPSSDKQQAIQQHQLAHQPIMPTFKSYNHQTT
jgi:hypothetical protein